MLYDAYTEAQGLVEVDLSAILDPSSVYVVSLDFVILSEVVPCPLPSCFKPMIFIVCMIVRLAPYYSKENSWWDGGAV